MDILSPIIAGHKTIELWLSCCGVGEWTINGKPSTKFHCRILFILGNLLCIFFWFIRWFCQGRPSKIHERHADYSPGSPWYDHQYNLWIVKLFPKEPVYWESLLWAKLTIKHMLSQFSAPFQIFLYFLSSIPRQFLKSAELKNSCSKNYLYFESLLDL